MRCKNCNVLQAEMAMGTVQDRELPFCSDNCHQEYLDHYKLNPRDVEAFKKELRELLEKYNYDISYTCGEGSDTHGIYDEKMLICGGDGTTVFSKEFETYIEAGDLE